MKLDLEPGSTLGILGGGQLARLTAIAARSYGLRVAVLDPNPDAPAASLADIHVQAALDDPAGAQDLAEHSDVVTCEFENVPAANLERCAALVPTRPSAAIFHLAQHRLREKHVLRKLGVPVADFHELSKPEHLTQIPDRAAIAKTTTAGYDGKGQVRVAGRSELEAAWRSLGQRELVVEAIVPFEHEISVLVARGRDGETTTWAPFLNTHRHHILDLSLWPAPLPTAVLDEAARLARVIATGLDLVGLLCVEMFLTETGELLVNELAPRPHNSGHLTIEASRTSQFDQLVRIAAGLPLGDTAPRSPAAMANLLGDLWAAGPPNLAAALAVPGVSLHLYGKSDPRPGRKMGHLTALADSVEAAEEAVLAARAAFATTASC